MGNFDMGRLMGCVSHSVSTKLLVLYVLILYMFMYVDYLLIHSLVRMVFARSLVGACVYSRLVVLSPRFNVGIFLGCRFESRRRQPFLCVNAVFSYRLRGVICLPISLIWY